MSSGRATPMILAIGARNDFLHVYHDEQELLADDQIGAGTEEISGPLEFFDSEGYRLVGKYDQHWRLLGLTRTEEPPNQTQVRWRVQETCNHLRSYLERNCEKVDLQRLPLEQVLKLIPVLDESTDFDSFLQTLVHGDKPTAGLGLRHNNGDPIHNLRHACGWKH